MNTAGATSVAWAFSSPVIWTQQEKGLFVFFVMNTAGAFFTFSLWTQQGPFRHPLYMNTAGRKRWKSLWTQQGLFSPSKSLVTGIVCSVYIVLPCCAKIPLIGVNGKKTTILCGNSMHIWKNKKSQFWLRNSGNSLSRSVWVSTYSIKGFTKINWKKSLGKDDN